MVFPSIKLCLQFNSQQASLNICFLSSYWLISINNSAFVQSYCPTRKFSIMYKIIIS